MSDENKARLAHDVLDGLSAGRILSRENERLLRSFLPELPKQMTLEEIAEHVRYAWIGTSDNEWAGNSYNRGITLESWMGELYVQLQGLKDTPAAAPALPDGMRIAVHAVYGRVVVSPVVDDDGTCKIFHLSTHTRDGSDYCWAPIDSLTFIDYEPAKPAHPKFLETEADYTDVPEGTILTMDGLDTAWVKKFDGWASTGVSRERTSKELGYTRRRVLRWGWGK